MTSLPRDLLFTTHIGSEETVNHVLLDIFRNIIKFPQQNVNVSQHWARWEID